MCYIKCAENEHLNQTQNNPPQRSTPGHPSGRTVCPRPVSDRLKRFDKTLPYGNVLSYTGVCRGALSRSKSSLRISRRSASYCEGAFNRYASSCERFRYASLPTASLHLKSRRHSPLPLRRSARSPTCISDGLGAAVYAKQRPGAQEVLDGPQKQRIVAMVCSKPPEGRARWTVRLIAEEAVKRK